MSYYLPNITCLRISHANVHSFRFHSIISSSTSKMANARWSTHQQNIYSWWASQPSRSCALEKPIEFGFHSSKKFSTKWDPHPYGRFCADELEQTLYFETNIYKYSGWTFLVHTRSAFHATEHSVGILWEFYYLCGLIENGRHR